MSQPLVSVVTPFFNTAAYLAECIESVLAQSYADFEYILMDNRSTDGSGEIAADYARRDRRIRLITCSEFLPQLANYNRALAEISPDSKYCKMVQADDWIFPRCLELMVEAFERSESIGLVSSFWVSERVLSGVGLPIGRSVVSGKECVRLYLRTDTNVFGSQTQVMYRSSLVRSTRPFYNVSFTFCDLQKCIEILENSDLAFVHQVLSFSRRENESVIRAMEAFKFQELLRYIMALRYAPVFLETDEVAALVARRKREYYRVLARAASLLPGAAFWRFHKSVLKALNQHERHDWGYLAVTMASELAWLAANPGSTTLRTLKALRRDKWPKRSNSSN